MMPDLSHLRVAIVHEWLVDYSGSERVVEQLLHCFPQADLFALVDFLPEGERSFIGGRRARTSFIQRLPFARRRFRAYLPLFPLAVEQFDLSSYDLVLSSSHAVAKGVLTGPDQLHVSYVHSPMRYAWDLQHVYLTESGLAGSVRGWPARLALHYLRMWDVRTAAGVDAFVCNSAYIARRIAKVYRREATVIPPPVDVDAFVCSDAKDDFYLAASRVVPYKKINLIVEAFRGMPDRRLVVIGDGPGLAALRASRPANVELMGFQSSAVLADHMRRARAFVFAAEEDFGIVPVEAQAAGTPVIAYGRGGATETVIATGGADDTGLFFHEQTPEAIRAAVEAFEQRPGSFRADACRRNAMRFTPNAFREALVGHVADHIEGRIPGLPTAS